MKHQATERHAEILNAYLCAEDTSLHSSNYMTFWKRQKYSHRRWAGPQEAEAEVGGMQPKPGGQGAIRSWKMQGRTLPWSLWTECSPACQHIDVELTAFRAGEDMFLML